MRLILTIFVFLSLNSFVLRCQSDDYLVQFFNSSYNIPDKVIRTMVVDRQGFIWLGTREGLYRFDGNEAVRITNLPPAIRSATITTLYIDKKDRLWIGTYNEGLVMMDLISGDIKIYNELQGKSSSLSKDRIKRIFADKQDNIWIATHITGIQRLHEEQDSFSRHVPSLIFPERPSRSINDIICTYQNPSEPDVVWLGTLNGILKFYFPTTTFELFECLETNMAKGSIYNGYENIIRSLIKRNDTLYVGTWGGGLCKIDVNNKKWTSEKHETPFPASSIRNVVDIFPLPYDENKILIEKYNYGVFVLDLTSREELPFLDDDIVTTTIDQNNRLWIAAKFSGLGLHQTYNSSLNKIRLPFRPTGILENTKAGKYHLGEVAKSNYYEIDFQGNILKRLSYDPKINVKNNFIGDIYSGSDDDILIRSSRGLFVLNESKNDIISLRKYGFEYQFELPLLCVIFDDDDNLWYGGKGPGIYKRDRLTGITTNYTSKDGAHDDWNDILFKDRDNNIWYGSERGFGVYKWKEKTFIKYDLLRSQRDSNKFNIRSVTGITQDKNGHIYIGNISGAILKIDSKNIVNNSLIASSLLEPSKKGSLFYKFIIDDDDNLWHAGKNSIVYHSISDSVTKVFSSAEGIINPGDIFPSSNGKLLIANSDGFQIFDPDKLVDKEDKFKFIITDFYVFNERRYSSYDLENTQDIILKHNENYFTVHTALMGITEPDLLEFEYKMDGLHKDWIKSTTGKKMSWTQIPPGDYTLTIRARVNEDWVMSQPKNIQIKPPFWLTWYFQVMVLGLSALVIYYFYRAKIKRTEISALHRVEMAQMEMKTLRAQMNPHFIFNCLNSIKLFIIEGDVTKAGKYISRFSKLLRTILHNSKSHYIKLPDELQAMELYMDMEKMRFEDKFEFTISIADELDPQNIKVPPMIFQPFIENAIWHGIMPKKELGKIIIKIEKEEDYLSCTIEDNGVGREKTRERQKGDTRHHSLGIQITKERLAVLNDMYKMSASIDIEDLYTNEIPTGTKVKITLPINLKTEV